MSEMTEEHQAIWSALEEQGRVTRHEFTPDVFNQGISLSELGLQLGLFRSMAQGRRETFQGGLRVNEEVFTDLRHVLTLEDVTEDGCLYIRMGKTRAHVLEISNE